MTGQLREALAEALLIAEAEGYGAPASRFHHAIAALDSGALVVLTGEQADTIKAALTTARDKAAGTFATLKWHRAHTEEAAGDCAVCLYGAALAMLRQARGSA